MEFVTTKKVDITPRGAITSVNPPIRMPMHNVTKSVKDIRRCILAGAKVEEVLPGGGRLLLNISNYDIDNSAEKPTTDVPKGRIDRPVNAKPAEQTKPVEPKQEEKPIEESKPEEKPAEEPKLVEIEPVKEEAEVVPAEAPKTESENQPSQTDANKAAEAMEMNLTKRQRRAMARAEAEKAAQASEEKVEVKDPEA